MRSECTYCSQRNMLQLTCGLHRAILLETNHRSLLPWVEKYVVRDVHAVSAE